MEPTQEAHEAACRLLAGGGRWICAVLSRGGTHLLARAVQLILDHAREGKVLLPCRELAARLSEVTGISIGHTAAARLIRVLGLLPSPKGGARLGAGRPRGSGSRDRKPVRKLVISNLELVQACRSAYQEKVADFDFVRNTYTVEGREVGYSVKYVPEEPVLPTVYYRPLGYHGGGKGKRGKQRGLQDPERRRVIQALRGQ
ncbi:hypothetical protein [Ammonifex degensii]|uniref:hypothetical protein n=1 Tax=Ammonifex degensii TaxID=42838 RepID=UPI00145CB5B6|nr:hypothetical protein [Ammonifex degensii]